MFIVAVSVKITWCWKTWLYWYFTVCPVHCSPCSINDGELKFEDIPLTKAVLENTRCFLLDCGAEMFVWVGRVTQLEDRKAVTKAVEVSLQKVSPSLFMFLIVISDLQHCYGFASCRNSSLTRKGQRQQEWHKWFRVMKAMHSSQNLNLGRRVLQQGTQVQRMGGEKLQVVYSVTTNRITKILFWLLLMIFGVSSSFIEATRRWCKGSSKKQHSSKRGSSSFAWRWWKTRGLADPMSYFMSRIL